MNRFFNFLRACTLWLCLGAFIFSVPAAAQNKALTLSTGEDVAMAFYKMAGERPAFDKWIKANPPYNTTPLAGREEVYKKEKDRLSKKWDSLDLQKNYLTVKATVRARLLGSEGQKRQLEIRLPGGEVDYFPYLFMNEQYALIPDKLQSLLTAIPTEQELSFMTRHLGPMYKKFFLTIQLKPVQADTSGTHLIDNHPQWLFLSNVASLALWSPSGFLLWEYSAPWFITPSTDTLNDLYQDPATSSEP